jgi:peptide-methionine (S)-S-oxide reductase
MRRPFSYLRHRHDVLIALLALLVLAFLLAYPRLVRAAPKADESPLQTAVFAGGCFWGVEAVFEHVRGVRDVRSGYAGGRAATAHYEQVGQGDTGHAEAVEITYDPSKVSYGQLLKVFFAVAHDPTQVNRQGPDVGTQYRSAIFTLDDEQARVAKAYIAQMTAARTFGRAAIATQVVPLRGFFPAEAYHQDFARLNPTHPYIVVHDAPKVARLHDRFPALYR